MGVKLDPITLNGSLDLATYSDLERNLKFFLSASTSPMRNYKLLKSSLSLLENLMVRMIGDMRIL